MTTAARSLPPFPNMTQIPSRLSKDRWQLLRWLSIGATLVVAGLLIAAPDTGLFVMWKLVIPLLPLTFLIAPGLWRNICPLAATNQTPRVLGITRAATSPGWLREYGYVVAIALFFGFVTGRKLGLDDSGPASALLLLGAMGAAFTGGMLLKGKSGWCSAICPLLPVQRIYGQTPFSLVGNSHCQPCVGCTKNCYDFNPRAAYLADLNEADRHWSGYRKLFVALFPGLVLAFFEVPDSSAIGAGEMYARIALYLAVSAAAFFALETFAKVSAHRLTTLFGATAFSIFYWYGGPNFVEAVADTSIGDGPKYAIRAAAIALAGAWVWRTWRKENAFVAQAAAAAGGASTSLSVVGAGSLAARRGASAGAPEVEFAGEDKRVLAKPNQSLLELIEANGLKIEAGCRMGVCGADPVAIKSGMECLSKISDDERNTLDRLGHADNTRMACCARVKKGPISVALTPDKAGAPSPSKIAGFSFDRSIERVVVLGNGIAGVTAADHVRRRHPICQLDLVGEEIHPLYNRMGISRLIYGRSAMQGLYLNADSWYEERSITTWLNTRAAEIDLAGRQVVLGTGEKLPFDRLILATGSRAMVPKIEGFGGPGTGVLRTAADALDLRAFTQRHGARRAVVAGGGLLGLEAAYALHKLGLRAAVLERGPRLLRRQLDERASQILRKYLEGLGIAIVVGAETTVVESNGRLRSIHLRDGRRIRADYLLVAAGITPNTELAAGAGIAADRGLIVDDRMATSVSGVYAAGDVAQHRGEILGLWPAAVEQAEVAADQAAGGSKTYGGTVPVTALKVAGIDLNSVGEFEPTSDRDEVIAFTEDGGQRYRKLVIRDGRIIAGAILLGYSAEVPSVSAAVRRGTDVGAKLSALRKGDWSVLAEPD